MDIESFVPAEPRPALHALSGFKVSTYLPDEIDALRRFNIYVVKMTYEGRFGQRQVGVIEYERLDGRVPAVQPDPSVTEAIAVFFRELLELRFPGWENAEGSRGYFEWHVELDSLSQHHAFRVIEYRTVTIDLD
jgi:hypothetical protein